MRVRATYTYVIIGTPGTHVDIFEMDADETMAWADICDEALDAWYAEFSAPEQVEVLDESVDEIR